MEKIHKIQKIKFEIHAALNNIIYKNQNLQSQDLSLPAIWRLSRGRNMAPAFEANLSWHVLAGLLRPSSGLPTQINLNSGIAKLQNLTLKFVD